MIKNKEGNPYINVDLLCEKLSEKGMDSSSIMKCLSVNRPTSVTKVYGSVAWRNIEIAHISKALNLTMEEIFEIFIKPCVQDWTPVDLISPKSDENSENL